jgi:hypothetical protein
MVCHDQNNELYYASTVTICLHYIQYGHLALALSTTTSKAIELPDDVCAAVPPVAALAAAVRRPLATGAALPPLLLPPAACTACAGIL